MEIFKEENKKSILKMVNKNLKKEKPIEQVYEDFEKSFRTIPQQFTEKEIELDDAAFEAIRLTNENMLKMIYYEMGRREGSKKKTKSI